MLRVAYPRVPPNTPKTSPLTFEVKLPAGILAHVKILIPPGHQALAGVRIRRGLEIIVPHHQDDWIKGDNVTVEDEPMIRLPESENVLIIEAYNEDEYYPHTFYIYFKIKREEELTHNLMYKFLKALRLIR